MEGMNYSEYVDIVRRLAAVEREADELRSEKGRFEAMQEVNETLNGSVRHGWWVPEPPPQTRRIPDRIDNPADIALMDVSGLSREELPPANGLGRRSYVELVRVGTVHPHPALYTEHLEVTRVYGLPVVVGKGEFRSGDIAIYLPLGTQVPPSELLEFIHQGKNYVIQTRRFRGVESCGVLLPARDVMTLKDHETGQTVKATPDCWNVWLDDMLGADVSGLLNMANPV